MAQLVDLHPSDAAAWRDAVLAHLGESHRRLGGLIERRGPLRLFANPTYGWTFFNTARQVAPILDPDIDALVEQVVRFYESHYLRPSWDLSQRLAPPSLTGRLVQAGFVLDRTETLMVYPIEDGGLPITGGRRGTEAGRITDYRLPTTDYAIRPPPLDDFIHAWQQGFAMGPDTNLAQVHSLFSRDLASGWEFWCAYQDGQAVGTLGALSLDGVVQIANVSTLSHLRRQGVATALMRHALQRAEAAGHSLVYLNAATGSPAERLYQRLGFGVLDLWQTYGYQKGAWWG
ncbi:MAG: GNAT family N-acetyltransferase [Anaerolineae bacterium]|nr:GNAT family N-acetyltransferase [Anaerolineae bacterium]